MNQTVKRIVDILFSETAETEETAALHEELMNNCQEHYDDLVAHGFSEDEAIEAVVESLKGMKEVIDEYPKKDPEKAPEPVQAEGPAENAGQNFETDGENIRVLSVSLPGEDVRITPSEDGCIRISCADAGALSINVRNDTLNVSMAPRDPLCFTQQNADNAQKEARKPFDWSLNGILDFVSNNNILDTISNAVNNVVHAFTSDEPVFISLPADQAFTLKLNSRSGDISVNGIRADHIDIHTASGDVSVFLPRECRAGSITVAAASGDISINAAAQKMDLSSISGEIRFTGDSELLRMKTVSGDAGFDGGAESMNVSSISGDIRADINDSRTHDINASTTSGDINVKLLCMPAGIHTELSTRSGDASCRFADAGDNAALRIRASSISGDIRIC